MRLSHIGRAVAVAVLAAVASLLLASSAYAIDTGFQYQMNPRHSGKCIDVDGGNQSPRAALMQFTCNDQPNQRFRFVRISGNVYEIRAVHSNQCLDVDGANSVNRARVMQFPCNGGNNQRVRLLDDHQQAGITTRIVAVHSNKCPDVDGGNSVQRVKVM